MRAPTDGYFGELIFLANEGVLIVPSHMGERPIRGMHGYHPSAKQSYAMLCTNQPEIPEEIVAIPDIFRLMTRDAEMAAAKNSTAEKIMSNPASLVESRATVQPKAPIHADEPPVSIIMRSYNEGWALRDTLPAMMAQDYKNWELIVIDSGSTDGSVDLIRANRRISSRSHTRNTILRA